MRIGTAISHGQLTLTFDIVTDIGIGIGANTDIGMLIGIGISH